MGRDDNFSYLAGNGLFAAKLRYALPSGDLVTSFKELAASCSENAWVDASIRVQLKAFSDQM